MTNAKRMADAFEKLSEAGSGILAIPPQNEKEHVERDQLMQRYLLQHQAGKAATLRKQGNANK